MVAAPDESWVLCKNKKEKNKNKKEAPARGDRDLLCLLYLPSPGRSVAIRVIRKAVEEWYEMSRELEGLLDVIYGTCWQG